ncbi:MAG: ATP-binding cassette domain-containing protein [Deltaproteobacteria bacterium]|nr:ATP-binding cassette domain-containing protein [Deltaproteobacteria bacterium]MCX7952460.1 ATP-binding cassette domain-containing protein [Deltaproteobacteria bacterium]
MSDKPSVVLKNVSVFIGPKQVLQEINLSFEPNLVYGLVGPSGGGKSVLLKTIFGILSPSSGSIQLNGIRNLTIQFQEGGLFDFLTVADNLAVQILGLKKTLRELSGNERKAFFEEVYSAAGFLNLIDSLFKYPHELSGGMKKRTLIGRAILSKPELIAFDDPIAGLDPINSRIVVNKIFEIIKTSRPITLISFHNLRFFRDLVDVLIFIDQGKVYAFGKMDDVLSETRVRNFFKYRL